MNIIGIDIGGTHFRIGIADENGNVSRFKKLASKSVLHSENILQDIAEFITDYSSGIKYDAVSIGFPATLNKDRTKILQAPNLKFMENLPVVSYLSEALKVPVFAERDVTMTLCYDVKKYNIPDHGIICGIYFGTGVGNAIMIDGKFLSGKNGTAGELGHIPVYNSDILCGCGNSGCIENLAGGKFLAGYYHGTDINNLFLEHNHEEHILKFIDLMSICIATEVNILDPDYIITGGGVLNMKGFPKNLLIEKIFSHVRKPFPAENLSLIFADDEPDKSVSGAAYYFLRRNGQV